MKLRLLITVFVALVPLFASVAGITPYAWEKDRHRYTLTADEETLSELVLKHHYQYEYVLEDGQFIMYSTIHKIIFVNNNEAIQKHNRIVISMNSTLDLVELKARAINKDGKVVNFDKTNLKELKNEESGSAYRIFAIEGIEMGSEVEYFFTRKMRGSLFDRTYMQLDVPIKSSSFLLTCPAHLKFDFKTYQDYPAIEETEDKDNNLNVYKAAMNNITALKKEPFSFFEPNRKRIEFKLAYNTARSQVRLYTWDEAAQTFYNVLYERSKDDDKALEKFVKTLDDKTSEPTAKRIKQIENKIKTSIQPNLESREDAHAQIESIIKQRVASREGMTKLFLATFNKLNIKCYPVITCSREDIRFDGDFDTWSYLDEYIIYFPETKGFMAPYVFESRYPLVPAEFTFNKGLFIEPFTLGEAKSALASIQDIPAASYDLNTDNLDIDVSFNEDLSSANIKQIRTFGGYNASSFVHYYDFMTAEQRTGMIEELTKQTAPDAQISKWTARTIAGDITDNFLVDVDFQTNHFLEKAGPRLLFKAGELIGPQVEMYRDDQRTTPVENNYNRGYDRKIKIHLPDGYQLKNAQDLKLDVAYDERENTPFFFKSDYTLNNNVLEINIKEYYKEIDAPVNKYENFRRVINAAADFNKITLVLEKKK